MPMRPPTPDHMTLAADARALAAAVLLFAVVLGFLNSCGTGDLVFPGNIPATFTPVNTATPVPNNGG